MEKMELNSAYKRLHPLAYYRRFIEEGVRPDGRELLKERPISLSVGSISTADGSALAYVGETAVAAGVKLEIIQPRQDTADKGELEVIVQMWPVCAPQFKIGAAPEEAVALGQFLTRTISNSETIDFNSLCLEKGKCAWIIRLDVVVLNHAGNVEDAAMLAAIAALQNTKVPEVDIEKETGLVTLVPNGKKTNLNVKHIPIPTTFIAVDDKILVDPSADEEELFGQSKITIVKNGKGQLCAVQKSGGNAIDAAQLKIARQNASIERVSRLIRLIKETNAE